MSKTIRIALCLSFLLLASFLCAQDRFQIGLGFADDVTWLDDVDRVVVGDSLFFTNGPDNKSHSISSDPRVSAFLKWRFLEFKSIDVTITAIYSRKHTNVTLWRTSEFTTSTGLPVHSDFTVFQARDALFVPIKIGFRPFTIVKVSVGGGPVFSDNAKSPGDREEFSPRLFMQRMDPVFTEFRHQFIHQNQRIVTFDYSLSIDLKIAKGFGVQAMWSGSLGTVSKPIRVIDQEVHIPLKRKSMHAFLTYAFDL